MFEGPRPGAGARPPHDDGPHRGAAPGPRPGGPVPAVRPGAGNTPAAPAAALIPPASRTRFYV